MFMVSFGGFIHFIEHHAGAVVNKLIHTQSIIIRISRKLVLQYVSDYWKLNENLIVNDFDKPYFALVFSS